MAMYSMVLDNQIRSHQLERGQTVRWPLRVKDMGYWGAGSGAPPPPPLKSFDLGFEE